MIEITLHLDPEGKVPLYIQLYQYIRHEIESHTIKPGDKLPSKRQLSTHLGVSQSTIEAAYQQLVAEGYLDSKPRKGLYVNDIKGLYMNPISINNRELNENLSVEPTYQIDFSHGCIALDHFPYSLWRKLTIQSLYEEQNKLFMNGDRQGDLALREEIAKHVYQSRGVICEPSQILIGAGTQYLISLLVLLIGRDTTFALEEPGFHRTRGVLLDQNVNIKPIPLDDFGLSVTELERSKARVVYVTPSHQFPQGVVMPVTKRIELLRWAVQSNGYIIEDDYDGEFRFKGKPIPSLQGLDTNNRVIYLGTFSKSLLPSIRISYMILPPILLDNYLNNFTLYKQTVSRLHQHTLTEFMKNGYFNRHLNKMRTIYRRKQKILIAAIQEHLGDRVSIIGENSGLHLLINVNAGLTEKELIHKAREKKVNVYPTSVYYHEYNTESVPNILLGYGGVEEQQLTAGIKLLKEAWF